MIKLDFWHRAGELILKGAAGVGGKCGNRTGRLSSRTSNAVRKAESATIGASEMIQRAIGHSHEASFLDTVKVKGPRSAITQARNSVWDAVTLRVCCETKTGPFGDQQCSKRIVQVFKFVLWTLKAGEVQWPTWSQQSSKRNFQARKIAF